MMKSGHRQNSIKGCQHYRVFFKICESFKIVITFSGYETINVQNRHLFKYTKKYRNKK